jgi:hypothetical protein
MSHGAGALRVESIPQHLDAARERTLTVVGIVAWFAGGIPFAPVEIKHRPDDVGDDLLHTAVALVPRRIG